MRKTTITIATLVLLSAAIASAQTGDDLLQQALKKVYEERDFEGAFRIYDRILREFASDGALAGKASTERVRAKELLARAEARMVYERLIRENADNPEVAETARKRLAEAALPDPEPGIYVAEFDERAGAVRGPVVRLTGWDAHEQFPAWSPDGKFIAFRRAWKTLTDSVVIRSLDTGKESVYGPTQLPQLVQRRVGLRLDWFHDGNGVLAFANGVLYRLDWGGTLSKLSSLPVNYSNFALATTLSRDGKILYLIGANGSGNLVTATVVAFDAATGQPKTTFPLPADATPYTPRRGRCVPFALYQSARMEARSQSCNAPWGRVQKYRSWGLTATISERL